MLCDVKYDFYNEYLYNEKFARLFDKRKKLIKEKYFFKGSYEEVIEEYFVEIFSWSVIPYNLLMEINKLLDDHKIIGKIIDPCCGNSFHTFIFNEFCNKNVITIDIQPEELPWIETIEQDGLEFIKNYNSSEDCLLLSWVDYDELTYGLLTNFKGNIVISFGNYEHNSFKYLDYLGKYFELIKEYILYMPWDHTEQIKICKRI